METKKMQVILDNVANKIGKFSSCSVIPPLNSKSCTVTATTTDFAGEVTSPTANNSCRLIIKACTNNLGAQPVIISSVWNSGPSAVLPSLTYSWAPAPSPFWIEAELDNLKQTPFGLQIIFNF